MTQYEISILFTALAFGLLIGYSVWRMFFHPTEPIFERGKRMTHGWLEPVTEAHLRRKLAAMQSRRTTLELELVADYNPAKLRELNELDAHIEVTENRLNGSFNKIGSKTTSVVTPPKSRMQLSV